jgi:hypothetical protein
MKLTLTEIFCEILTGIFFSIMILLILLDFGSIFLSQVITIIVNNIKLETITLALICFYFIGILIDPLGLLFDHIFEKKISNNVPSPTETKVFWKNVDQSVLLYRDNIWAYYFCYRNIFILNLPILVLFGIYSLTYLSLVIFVIVAIIITLLETALFFSMKTLLSIYHTITTSHS